MPSPIKSVVVLMLENASFDHVLGYLRPEVAGLDGVTGNETQTFRNEKGVETQCSLARTAKDDGYVTDPDPPHELPDVMQQLFGTGNPAPGQKPNNSGFASRYASLNAGDPTNALRCFGPEQIPAIATLAKSFTVCDAWHASVPGPTWPNRFFAHCASSGGLWQSPDEASSVWSVAGHSNFAMPTIFESLAAAGRSWAIYYHDIPQALALARLHDYRDRVQHISAFYECARQGTLPAYSFLEPAYFNIPIFGDFANDMHPPHDARRADKLVADVYNALRANDATWAQTLFLLVWDEHGGFYDHVPPPDGVSPDAASDAATFKFNRLGVRVPAIVVSPLVSPGVDHRTYDHCSISATLKSVFGLRNFLSRRDAIANAFDSLVTLATPRADTPKTLGSAADLAGDKSAIGESALPGLVSQLQEPISDLQRHLLNIASDLTVTGFRAPGAITSNVASEALKAQAVMHVSRYLGGAARSAVGGWLDAGRMLNR